MAAIKAAWDAVGFAVLKKLINLMKDGMFELSRAQDGSIKYYFNFLGEPQIFVPVADDNFYT